MQSGAFASQSSSASPATKTFSAPALVLTTVPLLMVLGNSVLIPLLPDVQEQLGITKLQASLLITLFSIPAGVVIPVSGMLSDRLTRKWIVVPALLLFGAGGVIAGIAAWRLSHPYMWMLAGRVLQGIGASGTAPIAMAWIGDLYTGPARSRILGLNEAGNAVGKVLSPILGSAVGLIAWFAVFFIFPALCVPVALLVWCLVPDPPRPVTTPFRAYARQAADAVYRQGRRLAILFVCGAAALFNLFGVLFYVSGMLESARLSELSQGFILAIPLLVLSISALAAGFLAKKRERRMKWMMCGGFAVLAASFLVSIVVARNPGWLVAVICAGACGTGMVLPNLNTLITSSAEQSFRGIVTSLYGSVRFLGVAFGPPVYTWLLSLSTAAMFITVSLISGICAALLAIFFQTDAHQHGHPGIRIRGEAYARGARRRWSRKSSSSS